MNSVAFLVVSMAVIPAAVALAGQAEGFVTPLSEALSLLGYLEKQVTAEGAAEAKEYNEYSAWCHDTSTNIKFQIESGSSEKERLEANIAKATADITASNDKIESLASSISSDDQERKEAESVRKKESADFATSEASLVDAIATLDKAVKILQKEMQKNPAAFAQVDTSNVNSLLKALSTIVDAATFPARDQKKLAALVQEQSQSADANDGLEFGAPAATTAYKTHSTSVFDMLEDLKEKAETQLNELRKAEATAKQNYHMLKNSLEDQIAADTSDLNSEKSAKAASQETNAVAQGDLAETTQSLNNDKSELAETGRTCSTAKADHESTVKSRTEELTALATAKKILSDSSGGAAARTYSFLEVDHQSQSGTRLHSRVDLANAEIVILLKKLAKENHSSALAQLASRIASTLRFGASAGEDPFKKVKQLITDLLSKLQAEAKADVSEKAYCDDELGKTNNKKAELDAQMTRLNTKIDQAAANSAQLDADVKELQTWLADLARSQANMDAMRVESHQEYQKAKEEFQLGLEGVRKAIGLLKEYYEGSGAAAASLLQVRSEQPSMPDPNHAKAAGAGHEIINTLEVVESDFAQSLATGDAVEADAEADYQKMTQDNKDNKVVKEQDVKYKVKELKSLAKAQSDLGGDKGNTGSERDAVLEYLAKLNERCVGKADTYEIRKTRRTAELDGLKEALSILEGETAFVQHGKKHGPRSKFLSSDRVM
jgi:hypothetical protein